jgi:hypothetical protein
VIIPINMSIEPVEDGGKHWINITVGECKLPRRGPFTDADEAKAKAEKLIQQWQPKTSAAPAPTSDDIIVLRGTSTKLDSDVGRRFVADATRAAEGLITDDDLREKYELTAKNLKEMAKNPALVKAIRDERERRIRNGTAAREAASRHFVRAPNVMGAIMDDTSANPRHRIEAAREIRATATGGGADEKAPDTEKFVITFNLGADHVERIEKTISVKPSPPASQDSETEQHLAITDESNPDAE